MLVLDMPTKIKENFTTPEPNEFQRRFAQARATVRLPLSAVAEAAGVSLQAISQFEKGLQSLKIEHFVAACDGMGVRVEWVLKGVNPMLSGKAVGPVSRLKRPAKRSSPTTPASEQ